MAQYPRFRSSMRRARGLGAAHHGVHHWWLQRVTAVALIPLSVWLVVALLNAMMFPTPELVSEWLASPVTALALALLVLTLFIHAYLGVQTVVEDYVKTPWAKYGALIANYFLCIGLGAICILSIMRLHLLDVGGAL